MNTFAPDPSHLHAPIMDPGFDQALCGAQSTMNISSFSYNGAQSFSNFMLTRGTPTPAASHDAGSHLA